MKVPLNFDNRPCSAKLHTAGIQGVVIGKLILILISSGTLFLGCNQKELDNSNTDAYYDSIFGEIDFKKIKPLRNCKLVVPDDSVSQIPNQ